MALKVFDPKLDPKEEFTYWTGKMRSTGCVRKSSRSAGPRRCLSPRRQSRTSPNGSTANIPMAAPPQARHERCDEPDWAGARTSSRPRPSGPPFASSSRCYSLHALLGILPSVRWRAAASRRGARRVNALKSPRHAKARAAKYGVIGAGCFCVRVARDHCGRLPGHRCLARAGRMASRSCGWRVSVCGRASWRASSAS